MQDEIKKLLSDLRVGNEEIPVGHLKYRGKSTTFVTWAIIDEQPALVANDTYLYSVVSVDIDVFSKNNYLAIVNQIKKIFISNDWVWEGDSAEMYENDTSLYHKTITFKKEKEINDG